MYVPHAVSLILSLLICSNVSPPSIASDEGTPACIHPCPLKQKTKAEPQLSVDDVFVQQESPSTPTPSASEYEFIFF